MGSARPRALSLGRYGNPSTSTKHFPRNEISGSGSELAPCTHPPPISEYPLGGFCLWARVGKSQRGQHNCVLSTLLKYLGHTFNFYLLLFHLCREGNCRHLTNELKGCRVSLWCWWVRDAEMWFHNSIIRLCTFTAPFISESQRLPH